MSDSLREQLTAALETAEAAPATEAAPSQETLEITDEQPADSGWARDEFGRFKAKDAEPEAQPAEDPEPWKAPPKSWRKELHEKYGMLDPDVARYIHEREQQFTKGVTDYKARAEQFEAQVKPIQEAIVEYGERLQQLGGAGQAFRQFLEVDRMLLHGSPEQKARVIAAMAQSVGVPLDGTMQIPVNDQQIYPLHQKIQSLEKQFEAQRLSAEQSRVDAFAASVPYWDDQVEADMVMLIQTGRVPANDLQSAWKMAMALNPDAQEQVKSAQAQKAQAQQAAARAKAAAVSPRSATPTASVAVADAGNIRQSLEQQFAALGGRI